MNLSFLRKERPEPLPDFAEIVRVTLRNRAHRAYAPERKTINDALAAISDIPKMEGFHWYPIADHPQGGRWEPIVHKLQIDAIERAIKANETYF